jgi:hypothetical protein
MQDILSVIRQLKRPKLLIRAARFGVDDYDRERHLVRILRVHHLPVSGDALMRLMDLEERLNDLRKANDAGYSTARHVDILIAIMGEVRLLRAVTSV